MAGRRIFDLADEAGVEVGHALSVGGIGGGVFPAMVEVVGFEDPGDFEPGIGAAGEVFEQGRNQRGVQLQGDNLVHNWRTVDVRF